MPSDLALRTMNAVHRSILAVTGGRFGWRLAGMVALELTTTGRRSGKLHSVLLTSPLQEGDAIVVVASRGGDDRHPAWFLNLRDHPKVTVSHAGGPKQAMRARIATDQEREALWPRVTAAFRGYGQYQQKTDRQIPLVFLDPLGQDEPPAA